MAGTLGTWPVDLIVIVAIAVYLIFLRWYDERPKEESHTNVATSAQMRRMESSIVHARAAARVYCIALLLSNIQEG